jgi:ubiquitin C-terminal hydrolase
MDEIFNRCSECGHESVTFEPFWVVSVPINAKTSKDIIDCFQV